MSRGKNIFHLAVKFLLLLAMIASPVYVFESGNPQPADFVYVVFSVAVLFLGGMFFGWRVPSGGGISWFVVLVVWVAFVNMSWAIIMSDVVFLRPILFYLYNLAVFLALVTAMRRIPSMESWVGSGVACALVVSGLGALFSLGSHIRPAGFFNNPNQLAYFSLLGLSILLVANDFKVSARPLFLLAFMFGVLGIFAASSLAAFGGLSILLASILANLARFDIYKSLTSAALVGLVFAAIYIYDSNREGYILKSIEARMAVIERKTEDIAGERKYDRILNYPEHTILGAGEGLYDKRFYPYVKTEIHSSFGTLIFAYGVVGLVAFLVVIASVLRHAPFQAWFVMAAPLIYSLTHMGLRTTMFWILIAFAFHKYRRSDPRSFPMPSRKLRQSSSLA